MFFWEFLPELSRELLAKKANTLAEDIECIQDPKEKQHTICSSIFFYILMESHSPILHSTEEF